RRMKCTSQPRRLCNTDYMKHIAGVIAILLFTVGVFAQPPEPPRPTKYSVKLRYYIPSPRDQHVAHYDAMIRHLTAINFEFIPPLEELPEENREDRSKNYITGAIDAANARKILNSAAVQSIQLIPLAPTEFKLPDGGNDPVLVRL